MCKRWFCKAETIWARISKPYQTRIIRINNILGMQNAQTLAFDAMDQAGTLIADAYVLRPGIDVRCIDFSCANAFVAQALTPEGVMMGVNLGNALEVRDDTGQCVATYPEGGATVFGVGKPRILSGTIERNARYACVSLILSRPWLEEVSADPGMESALRLAEQSFAVEYFSVDKRIKALACQIGSPPYVGVLRRLFVESRSLDILSFWLTGHTATCRRAGLVARRPALEKAYAARDILDKRWQNPPTIVELSRQLCTNPTSLKSAFQSAFGVALFAYVTHKRLSQARIQLECGALTVKQASTFAGYASASNFSTAFKRQFGISPTQVRR